MNRRKWLAVLAVMIGIAFLTAVCCFFTGSLESFPTAEQEEKVKLAAAVAALICAALEAAVVMKMKR